MCVCVLRALYELLGRQLSPRVFFRERISYDSCYRVERADGCVKVWSSITMAKGHLSTRPPGPHVRRAWATDRQQTQIRPSRYNLILCLTRSMHLSRSQEKRTTPWPLAHMGVAGCGLKSCYPTQNEWQYSARGEYVNVQRTFIFKNCQYIQQNRNSASVHRRFKLNLGSFCLSNRLG